MFSFTLILNSDLNGMNSPIRHPVALLGWQSSQVSNWPLVVASLLGRVCGCHPSKIEKIHLHFAVLFYLALQLLTEQEK